MTTPNDRPLEHVIKILPFRRRLAELLCVLFGHDWTGYGSVEDDTGFILEEHNDCGRCGLRNYDGSGYVERYEHPTAERS